jgi:uncharacterized protein YbjT (DUF2867 family)
MLIAVIGASGRTGRATVAHALEEGHEVVAVVRTAASAPRATDVEVADARDIGALTSAIRGVDAVVSCLGHVAARPDDDLLAEGATALLRAMEAATVERLIVVSAAAPFVAGDDPLSRFIAKPILRNLFHADDTRAMEQVVRASETDWTILRPSLLTRAAPRAEYRHRVDAAVWWRYSTRVGSVGRAAVDALTRPEWIRHAIFITG